MLCEGAIMVALAQILSYLKLMELPNGGSLTPAMFPIILFAVRWGLGPGLMAGFVFGLLQLIFDGAYAWGWQSMLLDYLVAFTPLGLAGPRTRGTVAASGKHSPQFARTDLHHLAKLLLGEKNISTGSRRIGNQPRHREKTYIKSIADSARSDTEKGG